MNIFKKLYGKILYGLAKVISFILDVFIIIIQFIVTIVIKVGKGILGLIGMGGCLLFIMLAPFGFALLFNPITLLILILFIVIPMLGTKSVSYLKYIKYTMTEFLYDRANYFIEGKQSQFKSFNEYSNKYKKMEEERIRREQQQRQQEQQSQWEDRFKQWYEYQRSQSNNGGYTYGEYGNGENYTNPTGEFKSKYEKSCDLLGVSYDSDVYQIKLAYRKKAKEYHPDLNKAPDATAKFQEINEAYEFLSQGNIERYKSMK